MNRETVACKALQIEDVPPAKIIELARSIKVEGTCVLYTGTLNEDGYGRMWIGAFKVYVHRLAAVIALGSIPNDREVHHTCHRRNCVNPDHLQLVTGPENEAAVASWAAGIPV